MTADELVRVDITDRVATILLSRPERLNALGVDLCRQLTQRCAEVSGNSDVHAVILRGAGSSFCAGADLKERADEERARQVLDAVFVASEAVRSIAVPVVAELHGYVLGGGLELAALCDYRVASDTAVLGLPEIGLAIIPGGGLLALAPIVPRGVLSDVVMTARRLSASDAARLGIIEQVVADGMQMERAQEWAQAVARHPRAALVAAKELIQAAYQPLHPQLYRLTRLVRDSLEGSEQQVQRTKSFAGRAARA